MIGFRTALEIQTDVGISSDLLKSFIKAKYFLQLVLRVLTNSSTSDVAGCRRQSPTFSIFSQTIKTLLRSTRTSPCLTLPTRLVTFSSRSVCRNQSTENIKKEARNPLTYLGAYLPSKFGTLVFFALWFRHWDPV